MISIKNSREIDFMRESNRIVAELLLKFKEKVQAGIGTIELDKYAEDFIRSRGGTPAFKGYIVENLEPYPGSICASVNSCIVHGIPGKNLILKDGDIIGIDVGVQKNGYFGDAAYTYIVGEISDKTKKLLDVTSKALMIGIEQAVEGARVGDVSYAIESFVYENGYFIADNLSGHGVGKKLHEPPLVPNIGRKGTGPRLRKGMTIAIEPMVNIGTNRTEEKGWEFYVQDGSLSAHFEHTILITENEPEILSKA